MATTRSHRARAWAAPLAAALALTGLALPVRSASADTATIRSVRVLEMSRSDDLEPGDIKLTLAADTVDPGSDITGFVQQGTTPPAWGQGTKADGGGYAFISWKSLQPGRAWAFSVWATDSSGQPVGGPSTLVLGATHLASGLHVVPVRSKGRHQQIRISGTVVDASGAPVAGYHVEVTPTYGGQPGTVLLTDGTGGFSTVRTTSTGESWTAQVPRIETGDFRDQDAVLGTPADLTHIPPAYPVWTPRVAPTFSEVDGSDLVGHPGRRAHLAVTTAPLLPRDTATIYAPAGRGWKRLETAHVDRSGVLRFSVVPHGPLKKAECFRIVTRATSTALAGDGRACLLLL
ncbi:hypothetical protein EV189_0337 [Motilibacter rhizosphaerae]|uniref:Carboxypeptidase family protein n=1 Tax=Motilibacter rhizosphaerae TaxID=598652 RepID=A0A4Q7NVF1_9ACTN|nr:carboxypeptidase-like regulatory domain-containing protein [Motilibacter rhizosphaerae]RZS91104.1 hypothetical protein EV189_0337 [Motilibacter rhizosphaerae]